MTELEIARRQKSKSEEVERMEQDTPEAGTRDKDILNPIPAHAALLQSVLLDVAKGVRAVAIGADTDYFWLDIDAAFPIDQLRALFPHIEEQFKMRAKAGVIVDQLEMTRSNAIELAKYLKQTYLREEVDQCDPECLVEINRIGLWAGVVNGIQPLNSFRIQQSFQLGLQVNDLGKIEDSQHHLFRIYGVMLPDQRSKKEWMKIPFFNSFPGHFFLGEKKGYWKPFFEHIIWLEKGLKQRDQVEEICGDFLTREKITRVELDDQIKPQEELLLLSQIKSFYTVDYEPSPIQGVDLLPSILNLGFCRTLSAKIGTNEKEALGKGISFLQIMGAIHTIVRVKNFELVTHASGGLLSLARAKPEFKDSLVPVTSKDSFLRVSCAWRDQWGRRWEIARFDACNLKSRRNSFEFLCNLFFRIDWILAIQLENEEMNEERLS